MERLVVDTPDTGSLEACSQASNVVDQYRRVGLSGRLEGHLHTEMNSHVVQLEPRPATAGEVIGLGYLWQPKQTTVELHS